MATCIAFLRGINVGGRNRLPMKELVQLFEQIGIHGARTYIQSGNIAFRCTRPKRAEIAHRIASAIQQHHGFEPKVHVLTIQELEHAVAANPYMDARRDPTSLHLWFLKEAPANPDLEGLQRLQNGSERFKLDKKVFYLHAPDGIGQSKLASNVETCLGTDATERNWQTVTKTLEMGWDLA
jgi:uncharacterized protein (DUF1697 family)